jgi:hypothetical protein
VTNGESLFIMEFNPLLIQLSENLNELEVNRAIRKIAGEGRIVMYTEFTETSSPCEGGLPEILLTSEYRTLIDRAEVYIFEECLFLETVIRTGLGFSDFFGYLSSSVDSMAELIKSIYSKKTLRISNWLIPINYHHTWPISQLEDLIQKATIRSWKDHWKKESNLYEEMDKRIAKSKKLYPNSRYARQDFPSLYYWHIPDDKRNQVLCIRGDLQEAVVATDVV